MTGTVTLGATALGCFEAKVVDRNDQWWGPDDSEGLAYDTFEEAEASCRNLAREVDHAEKAYIFNTLPGNRRMRVWEAPVVGGQLVGWLGPEVRVLKADPALVWTWALAIIAAAVILSFLLLNTYR